VADRKMKITSIETETTGTTASQTSGKDMDSLDMANIVRPKKTAEIDLTTQEIDEKVDFNWIKRVVFGASFLWLVIAGVLLFLVLDAINNWQTYSALQWASIATLILGPLLLIFATAYCLKQLAKLSGQAHALNQAATALSTPDKTVVGKSKIMSEAIAAQIHHVDDKLNTALARLGAMDASIQIQAETMQNANRDVRETVTTINQSVEVQKRTLTNMTETLDTSMVSLSNTLTMHTDNLAKAVQIAEQKIKEARISVEGATAKINSASDIVRSNTVQAASTLSASHEDIKSLGDIIRQRSEELDTVYKKHAGELTTMIEHLRDEQTSLGVSMEERLVKMRDLSLSAQASAESLTEASRTGKETIEALAESASLADNAVKARFAEMRDMVQYSTEHAQSISDMAAQRVQDSLELTRKEITRIEKEMADLQTRIGNKQPKSLELVPDDSDEDSEMERPENISHKSMPEKLPRPKIRTRLKLKPLIEVPVEEAKGTDNPHPQTVETNRSQPVLDVDVLDIPEPPTSTPLDHEAKQIDADVLRQNTEETAHEAQTEAKVQDDATIRRSAPIDDERKPKSKSGGLFRNIFSKQSKNDETSSLDVVAPTPLEQQPQNGSGTPPEPTAPPTIISDDDIVLADLAQLGLSANAVVDDGCIIEASNARAAHGHVAMSKCVAERLKNPVEHLVKSLAINDELSDKTIVFATRFDQTVEALSGNREAIRTKLESETGRAYLLCDAALNYGRA